MNNWEANAVIGMVIFFALLLWLGWKLIAILIILAVAVWLAKS